MENKTLVIPKIKPNGLEVKFTFDELKKVVELLNKNNAIPLLSMAIFAVKENGKTVLHYALYNTQTNNTQTKNVFNYDGISITNSQFLAKKLDEKIDKTIAFDVDNQGKAGMSRLIEENFILNNLYSKAESIENNKTKKEETHHYYIYITKKRKYYKINFGIIKIGTDYFFSDGGSGPGTQVVTKAP
jgi:hypothetical protein